MQPIEFVRRSIFKLTQSDFAAICDVRQSTVSRWETGSTFPDIQQLGKIREEARRRNINLPDNVFFDAPSMEGKPIEPTDLHKSISEHSQRINLGSKEVPDRPLPSDSVGAE